MKLNARSEKNLVGLHPDLVRVIRQVCVNIPDNATNQFIITEGLRTKERQKLLVASGASWTMNSRHLTGHAFDIAVTVKGEVMWAWPLYDAMHKIIFKAAQDVHVPIAWGGDWKVKDGPHFELPLSFYP